MIENPIAWKTKIYKTRLGKLIDIPCQCPQQLIGLDAIGCVCDRVWYVDETLMPMPDQEPSRPI